MFIAKDCTRSHQWLIRKTTPARTITEAMDVLANADTTSSAPFLSLLGVDVMR